MLVIPYWISSSLSVSCTRCKFQTEEDEEGKKTKTCLALIVIALNETDQIIYIYTDVGRFWSNAR